MCPAPMRLCAMARSEGHPRADSIVAGARAQLGRPFRPQGRGAGGQDCLGLVIAAARAGGIAVAEHADLPLRGLALDAAMRLLRCAGCRQLHLGDARPGDVLLQMPAARQVHLAIVTQVGIVEAHGGVRRVVERPLARDELWHSAWRLPMGDA